MSSEKWDGMPEFVQIKQEQIKRKCIIGERSIFIRFENHEDLERFKCRAPFSNEKEIFFHSQEELGKAAEQKITEKTKSIWFPFKPHSSGVKRRYISNLQVKNRYPVYVVSKNRWTNGLTTKALHQMGVKHFLVVEKSQVEKYKATANESASVITLPHEYLDDYEACDNLGNTKSKGPGAARNFCIDHSSKAGAARHWVMDDNLDAFHYLNRNMKVEVECASTLAAAEDFVDRFSNVPVAGMNYYSFAKSTDAVPPYVLNTRIYSCLLIDNASGYRWRGRYNEDTDLSLRVLKDGLCTIQFNAFLCGKVTTQRMKGGNTAEFYEQEGTLPKSQMIADLHPDVASVVWRFNRWHHHVNYSVFKKNKLIENGLPHASGVINYGMELIEST